MDELTKTLLDELEKKHGEELNLNDHHYFLFYKDGLFQIYFDEDEKTIKVDVDFMGDAGKVYFTDKRMEEELEIFGGEK
ncbi:hypothetical protein ACFQ38_00205 [Sporosarcina contaminans]|uniref:Uncharacterized protein n=1 Tax=Sporosarcina contaminans TaxID=633403 RepID=A0ABW3TUR2_9BACL